MNKLKDYLTTSFGTLGCILYFFISCIISFFPIFYIDVGFILSFVFGIVILVFPPSSLVFWIWGLIETINGFTTGFWAIFYYIFFAIGGIPYILFNIIIPFIQFIITICAPVPKCRRDPRCLVSEPLRSDIHPFFYIEKYDADTMEQSVKNELGAAYEWSIEIMGIDWTIKNFPEELDDSDISSIRDNALYAATLPTGSIEKARAMAYICKIAQEKIPNINHPKWRRFIKTSLFLDPKLKKPTYKL